MQRFLRDPRGKLSEAWLSSVYGERIALIRKHFSPSVAAVYAIPQLSGDGALEWWTSQQGMVTPYAALNGDAQQALLRAYDAHLATLDGLIEALRVRGLTEQAEQIQKLHTKPVLDTLYSVDGRLLLRLQDDPAPPPVPAALPEPPASRWKWFALGGLLLAAMLIALWWWYRHSTAPVPPVVVPEPAPVVAPAPQPEPAPEPKPEPKPKPKAEPARDSEWPTELVVVLETAERMKKPPMAEGGASRQALARSEIERIVKGLPDDTKTQLITFPAGQCEVPEGHGVFPLGKRPALLKTVQGAPNEGKAALSEGLKLAAASVDGIKRDALVFMFVGGTDACGQDLCAVATRLAKEKPRLRINVVDLSGTQSVASCLSRQARVGAYVWGNVKPDEKSVDLSREAAKMLAPAAAPGKGRASP